MLALRGRSSGEDPCYWPICQYPLLGKLMLSGRLGWTYASVWVDAAREGVGQIVERNAGQDFLEVISEKDWDDTRSHRPTSTDGSSSVHSRNFSPILLVVSLCLIPFAIQHHLPTQHRDRASSKSQANRGSAGTVLQCIRTATVAEQLPARHSRGLHLIDP
jgi:hypothetical protein